MPTLSDQVHDGPVALPYLNVVHVQANKFRSPQATAKQYSQHRVITLRSQGRTARPAENHRALVRTEPVPDPEAQLLDAFHAADPSRQFWTQQARIGGFIGYSPDRSQLLVDGVRRQPTRFQVHAIAGNHDSIERAEVPSSTMR